MSSSNVGQCLCGDIRWEFDGEPYCAYNCHCKMCRKAHGAAFGTYWFLKKDKFRWLNGSDKIVRYASSSLFDRNFCGNCGSVVPYIGNNDDHFAVVGGCHDVGIKSECEIFVAHKAPWFEITSDLPQFDDYPPETGYERVEVENPSPAADDVVRGSCLCGEIQFTVAQPFRVAHNCHCSRCRRGRAAAHTTNGFVAIDAITFLSGADKVRTYRVPGAKFFAQSFCGDCGAKLPRLDTDRGVAVTPLGSLDDDPGVRPADHIFVADKAAWYDITDELPQFDNIPKR